jgi:hypothetical protein
MMDSGSDRTMLDELRSSDARVRELRAQLEKEEARHASLLSRLLEYVNANPTGWRIETASRGAIPPGEGAGCPEKAGCANIGSLGNICFYVCKTVQSHH